MAFFATITASGLMLTACAGFGPFQANDTGGIISWSPEAEATAREAAANHCQQHGKAARITSIHRQYGDYIGFVCYWPVERPERVVRARS